MRKLIGLCLSMVLLLGLVAGCGSANSTSSTSSAPLTTLRVAYMPNMASSSALIAAIHMGYFKQVGLNIQLVQFATGPAEIAAMGSGNIDISDIGFGAHSLLSKGQAQVITLDCTGLSDQILANKDKGIKTIADLKGKTIGTSLGTSSQIILDLALSSVGMTEKDVKVVSMDPSAAVTAMVTGKIDAAAIWSPSTYVVKEKMGDKAIMLANDNTFKNEMQFPGSYVVAPNYAAQHKDLCVKFVQGFFKGMDYRKDHLKQVADWVAAEIKQDPATIEQTTGDANWLTSKDVYDSVNDGSLKQMYEQVQNVFLQQKAIPATVNVDSFVHYDIMTQAYKANQKQ